MYLERVSQSQLFFQCLQKYFIPLSILSHQNCLNFFKSTNFQHHLFKKSICSIASIKRGFKYRFFMLVLSPSVKFSYCDSLIMYVICTIYTTSLFPLVSQALVEYVLKC